MKISRILGVAALMAMTLTACSKPAPAPVAATSAAASGTDAKAFLAATYSHYDGSQMNFSPFTKPGDYFDPELLSLMDQNNKLTPKGDVGALDGDPICNCQDYGKLSADITVEDETATTAKATAKLSDTTVKLPEGMTLTYQLSLINGQWRIHDIASPDMPSLRQMLIDANKDAVKTGGKSDAGAD